MSSLMMCISQFVHSLRYVNVRVGSLKWISFHCWQQKWCGATSSCGCFQQIAQQLGICTSAECNGIEKLNAFQSMFKNVVQLKQTKFQSKNLYFHFIQSFSVCSAIQVFISFESHRLNTRKSPAVICCWHFSQFIVNDEHSTDYVILTLSWAIL